MQEEVVPAQEGLLLMQCSSPSRASTNASQDSQNSMEHAQKITPEHKQSQLARGEQKVLADVTKLLCD